MVWVKFWCQYFFMKKRSEKRTELIIKLGKSIAQFRKNAGLSQEQLAGEIDITPSTLSRIECGVTDTGVAMLDKISKALNVEVSTLFAEAEIMHTGLPRELEEIIRLLKNQKYPVINTALKQIEVLLTFVNKQK